MSPRSRSRIGIALGLALSAACSGNGNDNLGQTLGSQDASAAEPDAAPDDRDAGAEPDAELPIDEPVEEPDAAIDEAGAEDAGLAALTVRVRRGPSAPVPGATVLLHDATGALLGDALTTGASGQVTSERAPASVTVVAPPTSYNTDRGFDSAQLVTYTGVKSGDVLTVELALPQGGYLDAISTQFYDVSLPYPFPQGATNAVIFEPDPACVSSPVLALDGSAPLSVPVQPDCTLPARGTSLVAQASDQTQERYWFTWGDDLAGPPANGRQSVTLDQGWVAATAKRLRFTGYTGADNPIGQLRMLLAGGRSVAAPLFAFQDATYTFGLNHAVAPGLGTALHAQIDLVDLVDVGQGGTVRRRATVARRITATEPADLDYGAILGLAHSAMLVDGTDPLRPSLSFTAPSALTGIDAQLALISFAYSDEVRFYQADWRFVLPPGASELTVPALPPALAALFGPGPTTQASRSVGVASIGDDVSTSYDAFRARPVRLPDSREPVGDALPVRVDVSDCNALAITAWWQPQG